MLNTNKYTDIEKIFLNFCKVAIAYMKSKSPHGIVEKRKSKRTVFSDKQVKEEEVELYHHWQYFDVHWERDLNKFKETEEYLKEQNKLINREHKYPIYIIIAPLLDAIERKLSFDVGDDFLIERYRVHNDYWTSSESIEYHYIPLLNFSCEEEIKFNDFLEIRELKDDFKSEFAILYKSASNSFDLNLHDLWHAKYMVVFKSVWQVGEEKSYGTEVLLSLFTALRLLKPGDVGTKSRLMISGGPKPHVIGGSGGPVFDFLTLGRNAQYILNSSEINLVKQLFHETHGLVTSKKFKSIRTALDRLHLSYTRSHLTDKIIDYSIALESLLLSDNNEELLYRMSIRAAWLLRDTFLPTDTKLKVQIFYEMRSCIVHRGYSNSDLLNHKLVIKKLRKFHKTLSEKELFVFADDLIKCILTRYLEKLKFKDSIQHINEEIDAGILTW